MAATVKKSAARLRQPAAPIEPEAATKLILAGKLSGPMVVEGSLDLSGKPQLRKLPKGLSCYELDLSGSGITELPADLCVESSLVLRDCKKLASLPDGLCTGTLDLQNCTQLTALPKRLNVWFLNLRGCQGLQSLPDDAHVQYGSLCIAGCSQLTELPKSLKLLSTLDVSDCPKIVKLPPKLEVSLWIDVGGSGITRLAPPNDKVGLKWRGVTINHKIAFAPETITAAEVMAERNAEIRRTMMERMGNEVFMQSVASQVVHQDRDPGGPRRLLRLKVPKEEDLVFLSCFCPSTGRHYLMRVPPAMKKCHQAAAWMAGFSDPSKYKPIIET